MLTVFAAIAPAETYIIPQIPVGGGWSIRLLFSDTGTADVTFYTQSGTTGSVTFEGQQGLQTSEHLVIGQNQVQVLNLDPTLRNTGPLAITWAKSQPAVR